MGSGALASLARHALTLSLRCAFVLVLFEGAASIVLFTLDLPEAIRAPSDTRAYTRYDPELGWVNRERLSLPDLYGPGRGVALNARGFRGARDHATSPPPGRTRVICSGSGNTFGRGVGEGAPWCPQIEERSPAYQTVNMGQYGYGIDQSYLWYMRDGLALDHDVQLFAFSRADFSRMQADVFEHRGKPLLRVGDGALRIYNVPVPRSPHQASWLAANAAVLGRLRAVALVRPLVNALRPERSEGLATGELADLSLRVFEALQALHEDRGTKLLLIYLPTLDDYEAPRDLWRRRIAAAARARGIRFVDLVEELKQVPRREVAGLYRPGATSHTLSEAGHGWIARALLPHLDALHAPPRPSETLGDPPAVSSG